MTQLKALGLMSEPMQRFDIVFWQLGDAPGFTKETAGGKTGDCVWVDRFQDLVDWTESDMDQRSAAGPLK
jgi:hypothetical protein